MTDFLIVAAVYAVVVIVVIACLRAAAAADEAQEAWAREQAAARPPAAKTSTGRFRRHVGVEAPMRERETAAAHGGAAASADGARRAHPGDQRRTLPRVAGLQVALAELRAQRGLSASAVAEGLGSSRAAVSRIETDLDVRLSMLQRYVEALGGRLEVRAVFEDDAIRLL